MEPIFASLGVLFLYTLAYEWLLNRMIEDAKKSIEPERQIAKVKG